MPLAAADVSESEVALVQKGRFGLADLLCAAGLAVWFASGYVFSAILGFLLDHPLAHLLLTGSISAQVVGGAYAREGKMSLVVVFAAAVIGSAMFDPLFYWVGRRYGDGLSRTLIRSRVLSERAAARGDRIIGRYGGWAVLFSWYLPVPNSVIYAAVGSAGMSLPFFLFLDVLAALLWAGLVVGLGYAIGHPAVALAINITHYAWWIFGVSTGLMVAYLCWRHRDNLTRAARRGRLLLGQRQTEDRQIEPLSELGTDLADRPFQHEP